METREFYKNLDKKIVKLATKINKIDGINVEIVNSGSNIPTMYVDRGKNLLVVGFPEGDINEGIYILEPFSEPVEVTVKDLVRICKIL
jgi:hypothetical protein